MSISEGNLLLTEVCTDVRNLFQKTEKLKSIWKTVEDTNTNLNNKIESLQKEVLVLQQKVKSLQEDKTARQNEIDCLNEQLDQMTKREEELENEVRELRNECRNLQKKFSVPPKDVAYLKLRKFLLQIQTLMYKHIFPDADSKSYTLDSLKKKLSKSKESYTKQYNEMMTKLGMTEGFIKDTVEQIIRSYDLQFINTGPLGNDLREEIEAGILNMDDFEEIFRQSEIAQSDIKKCKQLADAYLYLKTNSP